MTRDEQIHALRAQKWTLKRIAEKFGLSGERVRQILMGGAYRVKEREYMREYMREYNQRPDAKAKKREYNQCPDVKAKKREYYQRPDVKDRQREYMREYYREYRQRPDVKAKRREYYREYMQRPDVKARTSVTLYAREQATEEGVHPNDILERMGEPLLHRKETS